MSVYGDIAGTLSTFRAERYIWIALPTSSHLRFDLSRRGDEEPPRPFRLSAIPSREKRKTRSRCCQFTMDCLASEEFGNSARRRDVIASRRSAFSTCRTPLNLIIARCSKSSPTGKRLPHQVQLLEAHHRKHCIQSADHIEVHKDWNNATYQVCPSKI